MEACEFVLESEAFSPQELQELCTALKGFARCDRPLAAEVVTVSEEEIRALNARERGTDRVTDVLSFPAMELTAGEEIFSDEHGEELDEAGNLFLGSVAVCEARAREQAQEYGHTYGRELFYLTVHGILHCLGYDHEREEDKRAMREKEEAILNKLGLARE